MEYKVICVSNEYLSECRREIERTVNELLCYGWKLQGGVSVSVRKVGNGWGYDLCQAMVKEN